MYVLEWRTVSALTRGLCWCLFSELRSNEGNKHQHNTRVSTETVRHESIYIILFLTRHNESQMTIKTTILTCRPRVSLARFSFCWWRHSRLLMTSQWPDNCDAIAWIMISNSLDIAFIHGIYSSSGKVSYHQKFRRRKVGCWNVRITLTSFRTTRKLHRTEFHGYEISWDFMERL